MNRFENGFDSFKKAIYELENRSENEAELKAIIMNFHHAIEVLFKHILYSKETYLIYKNMSDWINVGFDRKLGNQNNGNRNSEYTITFDEAVRRIVVICEEPIDRYTYNGFLNLCKLRNSLTHDEIQLNRHMVEHIIVNLLPMVTSVMQKNLEEDEKRQFDEFTGSSKYQKIMQQLIGNNLEWRIVTISNLLKLYGNKDYDSLSGNELRHLELTLSTLNVTVYDEELLYNIDNEYYTTHVSYLKQCICDILIWHLEEIEKKDALKAIIKETKIIEEIIREYLVNATLYVYGLVSNERYISFQDKRAIHGILNQNSFINNNDIFVLLGCIGEIVQVLVFITGNKKRKDLLESIQIGGEDKDTIQLIYSTLLEWFKQESWYNRINFETLEEDVRNAIESDSLYDEVNQRIWNDELYQELLGEFGEWGTIDRVEEATVEDLVTVVKLEDNRYALVYEVLFFTQTYSDHEYYDNGREESFVKITGSIEDGEFEIEEAQYMGAAVGFRRFKFN